MTPQEIFDFVVNHLRTMPGKCVVKVNTAVYCVYHEKTTGNRCAVGALFPLIADGDADLLAKLDNQTAGVMSIVRNMGEKLPDWFSQNKHMLQKLQSTHDFIPNWTDNKLNSKGERELNGIAEEHKLSYQPPEE